MLRDSKKSTHKLLVLINGLLPSSIISIFMFFTSTMYFPLGYLLWGWSGLFGLSLFVSIVPDVASWLFFGIKLVGAEDTANLILSIISLLGGILVLIGTIQNMGGNENRHSLNNRILWLIGGILTFPLGIFAIIAFYVNRPIKREKGMKEAIINEISKNKLPYILILPFIVFLFFTYIMPIFRGFYITLFGTFQIYSPVNYEQDPLLWTIHAVFGGLQLQSPDFISIENYLELFSESLRASSFQNALNNNIFFVIIFVPSAVVVSLLLAVLLNNKFLKGENAYTTIYYLPVVTSILVVSLIWWKVVFKFDGGLLNVMFNSLAPVINSVYSILNTITFGIIPANEVTGNVDWLSPDYLMESIAIMSVWRRVGFDVLILLAGLKSIPDSLYEAADIDGHGSWSKFKNITLPMLKGPLGVVIILELINGWLVFQELYGLRLAQWGGDQTLAVYLISNYADPRNMSFASTVGYFIFGMTAFFSLLGRVEFRNILKGFTMFSLLAICFSIPTNRHATDPRSLGFGSILSWLSYDILFLGLAFICLTYYVVVIVYRKKEIEEDLHGLFVSGMLTLFVSPMYMVNGYNTLYQSGYGSTPIWFIPSLLIGVILLITGLLMVFARYYIPIFRKKGWMAFIFPDDGSISKEAVVS
ncbi:MAG: carbohydrate ABC transporter permease [Candidatus Hodarchaeales archaeon]